MEGGRRRERERAERRGSGRLEDGVGERSAQKFGVHYSTLNCERAHFLSGREKERESMRVLSLCSRCDHLTALVHSDDRGAYAPRERSMLKSEGEMCVHSPLFRVGMTRIAQTVKSSGDRADTNPNPS